MYNCRQLVERIASMLNHFLFKLVGDKNKDLKVKNPEKYHFDPVRLLNFVATIITVILLYYYTSIILYYYTIR